MRISDWSSDVCSSDLRTVHGMYIWYGDILLAYSIGGLLLLGWVWLLHRRWFKRFDNPTSILRFSLGYLLLPFFLMTVMGTVYLMSHDTTELRSEKHTSELQSLMRISYAVFCLKK